MTSRRFRFLQTGDLHVGAGRTALGERVSLERAERMFDVIFATAKQQKCHAVLITGDVFDTKAVTNKERELVTKKLALYAGKGGIPTYVIPGNHDLLKRDAGNLDYLAEVAASREVANLYVAFSANPSVWELAENLFALGVPVTFSENQKWIEEYVAGLDTGKFYVFMGHGTVRGCFRNDDNWRPSDAEDAKTLSLRSAALSAPDIVWWAYGDIHKRQRLPTLPDESHGWYAGSPIQMNFGEKEDRGALVVALDCKNKEWSYSGRRYVRFDTEENGFAPMVVVTDADQLSKVPKGALVKLAKSVVIPAQVKDNVVRTFKVVDDRSTPEVFLQNDLTKDGQLEVFDPLVGDVKTVEREVLLDLQGDAVVQEEAKKVVSAAIEKFRERTYVS